MDLNSTKPSIDKSSVRQAIEDFIVVGGLATVGLLATTASKGIPTMDVLYAGGIAGLLGGLLAYARARQIQKVG